MFEFEIETAISAARLAGARILEHYAKEIIAEEKLGVDQYTEPVTAADREASRLIVEALGETFPSDAILSEEEPDDPQYRVSRSRVWIVDPMDGTAGFVKKDGDFGVQIGLAIEGEPVLGVVFLPFHDTLYHAVKNEGSFSISGNARPRRLQVSGETDFTKMSMALTRHHPSSNMARIVEEFGITNQVKRGSVGLKVGLIAEQTCDIYIHPSPRTKFWDTCAPQIILEEAGGRLTDLFGFPIEYDRINVQNFNGILATNGASHEKAIEKMRPLLAEFQRIRVTATKMAPGQYHLR